MAAATLRSALLSSCALRRLASASAPRAPRLAQPKVQGFARARRSYPAAFAASAMSTSSGAKEAPANNPGLQAEVDPATKGYFMQQTYQQSSQSCRQKQAVASNLQGFKNCICIP
ncbi:uncharacterized protein [Triticum aestivum]|uniref:uncharacterized protein isoform X2 n=1 Tax=Triticum aestivum TaxID=4565 RepID=UPI001D0214BC|nr:uncharacterized protein LOC123164259 isoform X2 [Triticum aestivum]